MNTRILLELTFAKRPYMYIRTIPRALRWSEKGGEVLMREVPLWGAGAGHGRLGSFGDIIISRPQVCSRLANRLHRGTPRK